MKTATLCLILPALALPALTLAACKSSNNDQEPAASAAAAAGPAQSPTPETLFVIGGGAGVSVDSVTEIQFDNPYEGLTFNTLRRIGQDAWETDTGHGMNETTKTADGFVLESDSVQVVVDLSLAEVKVSVGSDNEYGPYNIVMAR